MTDEQEKALAELEEKRRALRMQKRREHIEARMRGRRPEQPAAAPSPRDEGSAGASFGEVPSHGPGAFGGRPVRK